ncbi:MAG: Type 1 glutamine amidotransferase-like domain-containing protein [Chloroflexota bacterium]
MRSRDENVDFGRSRSLTRAGPLAWRAGRGWLVLGGGGSWRAGETGEVDAAALGWADLDRPVALVPTAGMATPEAEALLEYYADLGGPQGYVVPIYDAAGAQTGENVDLLEEAGLIYVADGPDVLGLVRAFRGSPALEAMARTFEAGAVVVGMGAGAAAFGAWIEDPGDGAGAEPGLGWLSGVVVAPRFEGAEEAHRLRHLLDLEPNCLGLGVPQGTALALGPGGEVENVGPGQVTVVVSGLEIASSRSSSQ